MTDKVKLDQIAAAASKAKARLTVVASVRGAAYYSARHFKVMIVADKRCFPNGFVKGGLSHEVLLGLCKSQLTATRRANKALAYLKTLSNTKLEKPDEPARDRCS